MNSAVVPFPALQERRVRSLVAHLERILATPATEREQKVAEKVAARCEGSRR